MSEKVELLEVLKDALDLYDKQYDSNLERQAALHREIETYKDANRNLMNHMREIRTKINELEKRN